MLWEHEHWVESPGLVTELHTEMVNLTACNSYLIKAVGNKSLGLDHFQVCGLE